MSHGDVPSFQPDGKREPERSHAEIESEAHHSQGLGHSGNPVRKEDPGGTLASPVSIPSTSTEATSHPPALYQHQSNERPMDDIANTRSSASVTRAPDVSATPSSTASAHEDTRRHPDEYGGARRKKRPRTEGGDDGEGQENDGGMKRDILRRSQRRLSMKGKRKLSDGSKLREAIAEVKEKFNKTGKRTETEGMDVDNEKTVEIPASDHARLKRESGLYRKMKTLANLDPTPPG